MVEHTGRRHQHLSAIDLARLRKHLPLAIAPGALLDLGVETDEVIQAKTFGDAFEIGPYFRTWRIKSAPFRIERE